MYKVNDEYAENCLELKHSYHKNIRFIVRLNVIIRCLKLIQTLLFIQNDCLAIAFKEKDVQHIKFLDLGEEIYDHQLVNFRTESLDM